MSENTNSVPASVSLSVSLSDKFLKMCEWGYLEDAKKLLNACPNEININIYQDQAFRLACGNGHLEVANWLLSINKNINVRACNHWAAKMAKINGHYAVLKMLKHMYSISDE